MAFINLSSSNTGYTVAGSANSYLLRTGAYIGNSGSGISATGIFTNNDYTIDGFVISGQNNSAIYLAGKDGNFAGTNTIEIGLNGIVSGGRGIYVTNDILQLTNNGSISGDSFAGILLFATDVSGHSVVNNGTITGRGEGIDIRTNGSTIINNGTIHGQTEQAITIAQGGNHLTNTGSMTSASSSSYQTIFIGNGGNTIHNSGLISGDDGDGIYLAGGSNSISNSGDIIAGEDAIYLAGGNNVLTNQGTITGMTSGVNLLAPAAGLSNHSLINSGTITGSLVNGATVSGGGSEITNSGIIQSYSIHGLAVTDGQNTVVNTGDIIGVDSGVSIFDGGNGQDHIENYGLISASEGDGIYSQADETTIFNATNATISAQVQTSLEAAVHVSGDHAIIVNEGTISSQNGMGMDLDGANAAVYNSGLISSESVSVSLRGDDQLVKNSGTVFSESSSAILSSQSTDSVRLINTGTIASGGTTNRTIRVLSTNAEVNIVNSGEIYSVGYQAINAIDSGAGSITIRNSGEINGDILLNADDIMVRSQTGLIDGEIRIQGNSVAKLFLGDEDNTVYDYAGGADRFDLGGGSDTVDYSYSATAVHVDLAMGRGFSGSARGDRLLNVENLIGSDFQDILTGDDFANELTGEAGNDILEGQGGNDILFGSQGRDELFGDAGEDVLIGGAGGDDLYGGAHVDVFVFENVGDSAVTGVGRDRIMDFQQGLDLIDLSALGIEDFIFQAAFTGGGTSEVRYQGVGGNTKTLVQIDIDGDGNADSAIIIDNDFFNLKADDFALGG